MFLLVAVALLLVLPAPWNLIGGAASLAAFAVEVVFWNRTVRGRRAVAGAETLVGTTGTAVSECRPDGQVRIGGEIWDAFCAEGAEVGDAIVVTGRDGLTLLVTAST